MKLLAFNGSPRKKCNTAKLWPYEHIRSGTTGVNVFTFLLSEAQGLLKRATFGSMLMYKEMRIQRWGTLQGIVHLSWRTSFTAVYHVGDSCNNSTTRVCLHLYQWVSGCQLDCCNLHCFPLRNPKNGDPACDLHVIFRRNPRRQCGRLYAHRPRTAPIR
jgi:hypothetical protein